MSNRRPTGMKAELRNQYGHLTDQQLNAEVARLRIEYGALAMKLGAATAVQRKRHKAEQRQKAKEIN